MLFFDLLASIRRTIGTLAQPWQRFEPARIRSSAIFAVTFPMSMQKMRQRPACTHCLWRREFTMSQIHFQRREETFLQVSQAYPARFEVTHLLLHLWGIRNAYRTEN